MLGKLAAWIALQQSASANSVLLQRLLDSVGAVIFFALTAAFLVSVLIAGAVCLLYNLLLEYGGSPHSVMLGIGIALALLCIALGWAAQYHARQIKRLSKELVWSENPLMRRLHQTISAFFSGLQGTRMP